VIATVIGARGRRVTQSRLRGYRRGLEEASLRYEIELVEEGSWEIAGAVAATRRLLERRPDITAIFAQNDTMAIGVLAALRELTKSVPGDCAVVGCDDIDMAAYTVPSLSTVHVPFFETGSEAMRLLLKMISTGSVAPTKVLLPVQLVPRASSGGA
jgi:DNA-binding LacI/PurR family transcriptional regulator